ncbi:MAG: DUF5103 domain-containing protein [Clostridium sp.]|nr:DUF5103 domain-containing protein [Clostridium sp.]
MVGRRLLLAVAFAVGAAFASLADDSTMTRRFSDRFRTIQAYVDDDDQSLPVIRLGGNERLTISFDELTDTRSYLRYELIHCDRDWRPDGLVDSEFLDGFNQGEIDDYAFSRATLTHYVNYRLTIPNEQISPTISGNYLVRIYDEDDPDKTLLQIRFSVNEASMKVGATVSSRTDTDYNEAHQQVDLSVDADYVDVRDMWRDIFVTVTQNSRPDTRRSVATPLRVDGSRAIFTHNRDLIFPAGNEFRRFETVSVNYPGMGVAAVERTPLVYRIDLYPDEPRSDEPYLYDQTQFGRFRIREYNSDDSSTEADYAEVTFRYVAPELRHGDIFVDGNLTGHIFGPESRMVYNRAAGAYELTMLLKQGAYNYQYLTVPYGSMTGTTAETEGDRWQTVNEYDIRVYYRAPGERYDRLVAHGVVYSGR